MAVSKVLCIELGDTTKIAEVTKKKIRKSIKQRYLTSRTHSSEQEAM